MKRLRFITVLIALCAAVSIVGCGDNKPQPSKIMDGNTVTLTAAWDYALINADASADFWVETRATADYRSDEAGRRAGAVYFETEDGSAYVFADKARVDSETATVYMVGKSGEETATYEYATDVEYEGANHATDLKVVFAGGVYYVRIDGSWLKIDDKTAATKSGEFDFFTRKEKKYGVGNAETGASTHEKVAGGTDVAEQLKECLVTLSLDCEAGGSATLGVTEALKGEKVTVTVTPADESYLPIVTFNGRALTATGENTYELIATVSGTIEVRFARAFNVSGEYDYAAGLYADGDEVIVRSETAGLETAGKDGEFSFRLTPGEHELKVISARFGEIATTVTVTDADVAISDKFTFDKLAFTDGTTVSGGATTLADGDYKTFAGVKEKNFFVEATVKRMDEGETVGGVFFNAGSDSPVKILAFEDQRTHNFKIRLTRGKDWDGRSDRDYATDIPFAAEYKLSVAYFGKSLYVGLNDKWTAITAETPHVVVVNNTDFDPASVWNEEVKTFGLLANGVSAVGYPISGVRYGKATEATVDDCYYTLTATCADEKVTAALNETKVLKGGKAVLTLSGLTATAIPEVEYNGKTLKPTTAGVYEFTATASGAVTVTVIYAHTVSGTYTYASGLYSDGDIVTIKEKSSGALGTAENGAFSIPLVDGAYTLVLASSRYAEIETEATVNGEDVTLSAALTFTTRRFEDGTKIENGAATLVSGEYKAFAGMKETNFYAEAVVKRMDNGESTGGVYYYSGADVSPVKILAFENQETHNFKLRITRGTDWNDRSDRDYATDIPFTVECKLSVAAYGGALYVGLNGVWTKITAETPHVVVVNNADFGAASVWNGETIKTFGLFANGSSESGFPISGIRYGKATEATVDDCYYTLSVVCADEKVTAALSETKVLKGGKATLTLSGLTEAAIATVTYNGETLKPTTAGVYEFTATASGEVTVIVTYAYIASGTYTYASGLYSDGDIVSVKEKQSGALGTAGNGTFSIPLTPGTHTIVLTSARFADAETEVTIGDGNVTIDTALEFTTMKFESGQAVGAYEFTADNQAVYFGGISVADFVVTADYTWLDGETSSGFALKIGGVQYRIFAFDNGGKVKICVRKGTDFWDNRNDLDYATDLDWNPGGAKPWTYTMKVVFNQGVMYVGINGKFVKITTDTAYTLPLESHGKGNISGAEFLNTAEKRIGFVAFDYKYENDDSTVSVSNISFSVNAGEAAAEIEAALAE